MKLTPRAILVPLPYSIKKIAPENPERNRDRSADQGHLDGTDDGVVGAATLASRSDAALTLQPPVRAEEESVTLD